MSRLRHRRRWVPLLAAEDAFNPDSLGDGDNDALGGSAGGGGDSGCTSLPAYAYNGALDTFDTYAVDSNIQLGLLENEGFGYLDCSWFFFDPIIGRDSYLPQDYGSDTFNESTEDATINGQGSGSAWSDSGWTGRDSAFPVSYGESTFESASVGVTIDGQSEGVDWNDATWVAREQVYPTLGGDNFDSYSAESPLTQTLDGGTNIGTGQYA
jgi:hypothetical protein